MGIVFSHTVAAGAYYFRNGRYVYESSDSDLSDGSRRDDEQGFDPFEVEGAKDFSSSLLPSSSLPQPQLVNSQSSKDLNVRFDFSHYYNC